MGLSIYYRLKASCDADGARSLVGRLRELVATLPFDEVTEVHEYDPPDGRYAFARTDDDPDARQWKPGDLYLRRRRPDGQSELVRVPAQHVVCFHANLKGAETASFGLASHPPVVVHRANVIERDADGIETTYLDAGDPVEFPTRLRGWYSWSQAVKTQYAGDPRLGGAPNFLRAHRGVFDAVDAARVIGMRTRIRDDAKFWRHRDEAKLLAELARWDELIAGFVGRVSDALGGGGGVVAPIKTRPDYEHLEARGDERLTRNHGPRPEQ